MNCAYYIWSIVSVVAKGDMGLLFFHFRSLLGPGPCYHTLCSVVFIDYSKCNEVATTSSHTSWSRKLASCKSRD